MSGFCRNHLGSALALSLLLLPILAQSQSRMTSFDPATDGFLFANTFTNNFISELDIRTSGLCGGMAYTALDYFNSSKDIPRQTWPPDESMPLRHYIYERQVTSITENTDKWLEVMFNPFGARNQEFFNWGVQDFGGGRLEELRRSIDAGTPVPLGLRSCGDSCRGDHQVLAIGYDMGRYGGRLGQFQEDLKIYVYDPNLPGAIRALVPRPDEQRYYFQDDLDWAASDPDYTAKGWHTYFVDSKYRPQEPLTVVAPSFPADGKVHALLLGIGTGADDLRGGSDNVNATVSFWEGENQSFPNINRGQRWVVNQTQWVQLPLDPGHARENLKSVTLETTSRGGVAGDNWTVNYVVIRAQGAELDEELVKDEGIGQRYFHRFTGERPTRMVMINRSPPAGSAAEAAIDDARSESVLNLERGMDRPGQDYRSFDLEGPNFRLCQRACENERRCKAYTYTHPRGDQPARCYLKSEVPDKVARDCCISGVKVKYLDLRTGNAPVSSAPGVSATIQPIEPVISTQGRQRLPNVQGTVQGTTGGSDTCHNSVQGRIAWDYSGSKNWAAGNLNRLCAGAETSVQPGACFERAMHGGIDHGGGTRWTWQNALALCAGSTDSAASIRCFQDRVDRGDSMVAAIERCSS